jgi:zinc transporter 9
MGLPVLLAQCIAMFVASMLVGSLPLMFKATSSGESSLGKLTPGKQLKAVSVLGMGILVGAALTIIIPE